MKSLLILVAFGFTSIGNAQTCAVPSKVEGVYAAACTGSMTAEDGENLQLSKGTFEIMQSPSDSCKLLIGVIVAADDKIPYFRVGEFASYSGTFNHLNFADYNPTLGVLNTTQVREQKNGRWVQVGSLQFTDGMPKAYWSKTKGPDRAKIDYSCDIKEWLSELPFRPR